MGCDPLSLYIGDIIEGSDWRAVRPAAEKTGISSAVNSLFQCDSILNGFVRPVSASNASFARLIDGGSKIRNDRPCRQADMIRYRWPSRNSQRNNSQTAWQIIAMTFKTTKAKTKGKRNNMKLWNISIWPVRGS
jgi:hypothetical protein